jgi:hypothetical protein
VHYTDPDDLDAAMRRLHDLETRDRAGGALGHKVIGGCCYVHHHRPDAARSHRDPCAPLALRLPGRPRSRLLDTKHLCWRGACEGACTLPLGHLTPALAADRALVFAKYLKVRPQLVETVAQVAGLLGLSNDVVHLALTYLDRFNAKMPLAGARLLAALACLVVAAKFLEVSQDDNGQGTLPSYSHVVAAVGNPVGIANEHLIAWERRVLEVLDWQLIAATTSCFVHAYCAKGIFCPEDTAGPKRRGITRDEQGRVCDSVTFLCELATLRGITCAHGASESAAAAVCAARIIYGIHPHWPPLLAQRLGKTRAQIDACTQTLLHHFRTQHPDEVTISHVVPPVAAADYAALPSASPEGPRERASASSDETGINGARDAKPHIQTDSCAAGRDVQEAAEAPQGQSALASHGYLAAARRRGNEDTEPSPPPAPPSFEPWSHAIAGPRSVEDLSNSAPCRCGRGIEGPPRKAARVFPSPLEKAAAGVDAEAGGGSSEKGDSGGRGQHSHVCVVCLPGEQLGKRKREGVCH